MTEIMTTVAILAFVFGAVAGFISGKYFKELTEEQ